MLKKLGTRIFWCGDELYLEAGRELPPDEFYEEHTQLENGVGMLRLLETEFRSALKLSDAPDGVPFSIATGVAAAPYFRKACWSLAKRNTRSWTAGSTPLRTTFSATASPWPALSPGGI